MKNKTRKNSKIKNKRLSKGVRLHVRRMKQTERKESIPTPPK